MSKSGLWGSLATICAFLINPALGIAVGMSSLTAAAVFSDAEQTTRRRPIKSNGNKPAETGLRDDFEQLTEDIPDEQRERLYQAVSAELTRQGQKLLGDKDGQVALARKDGKILAWISEDGEEGHVIEFQMP